MPLFGVNQLSCSPKLKWQVIESLTYDVENEWGLSRIVYLKDEYGNRFKYFGTAKAVWNFRNIGDKAKIEFVIKEHKFEDKYFKFDGVVPYNLNMISKIKNK